MPEETTVIPGAGASSESGGTNSGSGAGSESEKDKTKESQTEEPKVISLTEEEYKKKLTAEGDKRVEMALRKKEAELERQKEEIRKEAMAEGERLAKMSQEERLKAEKERDELKLQQDREALEKERADFNRQKLLLETEKILVERKLPPTFAEVLVGADADTTLERINTFEQRWLEAVDVEVTERLKGKTPTGFAGKNLSQLEQLQREHDEAVKNNRPLEERLSLKNQIYELQTQKG